MKIHLLVIAIGLATVMSKCNLDCVEKHCPTLEGTGYTLCAKEECGCEFHDKDLFPQYFSYASQCLDNMQSKCSDKKSDKCTKQANKKCTLSFVPQGLNKKVHNLTAQYGCYDNELSTEECHDMYLVAIGHKFFPEAALLSEIHSENREAMKRFVKSIYRKKNMSQYLKTVSAMHQQISIDIDEDAINDFLNDVLDFQMQYESVRQQVAQEFVKDAQNAYKTTLAKLYLDFGKTVYPLVEAYANVIDAMFPNSTCNRTCLIDKCALNGNFSNTCQKICQCDIDYQKVYKTMNNFDQAGKNVTKEMQKMAQEILKQFEPVMKLHMEKEQQLTKQYLDMMNKFATTIAGCNSTCVNNCTTQYSYDLHQAGHCFAGCYCDGGAIQVDFGEYNPNILALYHKNDTYALQYFDKYFPY